MSDTSRLSRLTSILLMLQANSMVTATKIAKKFDITTRTVYRDIRALEAAGVPIVTQEGKGYTLLPGYKLPPVMFTEEEANALITAQKLIERNKDGSFLKNYAGAIEKIKSVLNYGTKAKTELLETRIASVKSFSPLVTSNFLSTIQIAITDLRLIKIKYQRITDMEISTRKIEALALYQTQENWICIAWCRLRKDLREFRLDRIMTMELTEEKFEGRTFDFVEYFKKYLN